MGKGLLRTLDLRRAGLVLLTALPNHAPAAALDKADLLDLSIEDLLQIQVRVASKIPTTTLDAAASVAVIPEAEWQRRGARTISDALESVSGVAIAPALGGADAFAIRGYTRSTSLLGVLVSWDGVPLNDLFRGAPTLELPGLNLGGIDEIQIVEGPGSALYGADAFHGVVALEPYAATDDERTMHADVRSNGYYAAGLRWSQGLGEKARMSLAVNTDGEPDQDLGFQYAAPTSGIPTGGERDNHYAARSLSFKAQGNTGGNVTWHGSALVHDYDGDDFQGFGTRLAGARDFGGIDTNLDLVDGGVRRDGARGTALELSAYTWRAASTLFAGRNAFDFESLNEQRRSGLLGTFEKALPKANTKLAVVAGIEELEVERAATRNYDITTGALTLDSVNPASGATRRIRSATFEGTTRWASDHWLVTYGARVDDYSDFGSQTSPRVGLVWHPRQNDAVKLLYGGAFRAPTANDLRGTIGLIEANPNLEPETIDTTEIAFVHQAAQWLLQTSVFHSAWRDGIVSVANPGGSDPFVFTNLERNSSHGVTAKASWQNDAWVFNAGASWVRSENDTRQVEYGAFPRYTVDAEVGYRHARMRTRFSLVQHWQIDTDDVFQPSAGIPALSLPRYARTDIGATRPLGSRTNLMLFVRNVFDRDNFYPSSAGSRGGIPDLPRTFSAEVRFAL
jgi:iron complex outermembrane receptor protein